MRRELDEIQTIHTWRFVFLRSIGLLAGLLLLILSCGRPSQESSTITPTFPVPTEWATIVITPTRTMPLTPTATPLAPPIPAVLEIFGVASGSPADQAGFRTGQKLLTLNGQYVADVATMRSILVQYPSTPITAVVLSDGKELSLVVTPIQGHIGLDLCAWECPSLATSPKLAVGVETTSTTTQTMAPSPETSPTIELANPFFTPFILVKRFAQSSMQSTTIVTMQPTPDATKRREDSPFRSTPTVEILEPFLRFSPTIEWSKPFGPPTYADLVIERANAWVMHQPLPTTIHLHSITCPTINTCFAVGSGGTIAISNDRGTTWHRVWLNQEQLDIYSISCPTPSMCLAGAGAGTFLTTHDGGSNWDIRTIPGTDTIAITNIHCSATLFCVAVGDTWNMIMVTYDGGATWSTQPSPDMKGFHGASCPSDDVCIVGGDEGTIMTSNDKGTTWNTQKSGTRKRLTRIACSIENLCIAVGEKGIILSSRDHGITWQKHQSGTNATLFGISCTSLNHCVAVGERGTILTTDDGGARWQMQPSGTRVDLRSVSCPRKGVCFAVGEKSVILVHHGGRV